MSMRPPARPPIRRNLRAAAAGAPTLADILGAGGGGPPQAGAPLPPGAPGTNPDDETQEAGMMMAMRQALARAIAARQQGRKRG